MRIVIPSYNRSQSINDKSLATLYKSGYKPREIDLFVANEEQYELYRQQVHPEVNIIVGCLGLRNIRNFIFNYYPEGEHLLCLDDDIEQLKILNPETERLLPLIDFKEVVEKGFSECENNSLKLWGLYTCCNPRFMNNMKCITYDYKFIIGNFFGCINCSDMNELHVDDIDDYERSIRSFVMYGGQVRFNHISAKTKFMKNTGGAQSDEFRNDTINKSIDILNDKYPDMLYLKTKKGGIGRSIILKERSRRD